MRPTPLPRACWSPSPARRRSVASRPWHRRPRVRGDGQARHRLHPVRGRRPVDGQPPRHRRHRRGRSSSATATGKREYAGRTYERARWTAPWQMSSFAFTELVASWSARTPGDSLRRGRGARPQQQGRHVELGPARPLGRRRQVRAPHHRSRRSPTTSPRSTSTPGRCKGTGGLVSWQLRVSLFRKAGTARPDRVDRSAR